VFRDPCHHQVTCGGIGCLGGYASRLGKAAGSLTGSWWSVCAGEQHLLADNMDQNVHASTPDGCRDGPLGAASDLPLQWLRICHGSDPATVSDHATASNMQLLPTLPRLFLYHGTESATILTLPLLFLCCGSSVAALPLSRLQVCYSFRVCHSSDSATATR
jgi:hypothetical protein